MKLGYKCDTCGGFTESCGIPALDTNTENQPWPCPVCGKEACSKCYYKFATHKTCCVGKTDTELIALADAVGWDFGDR